MALKNMGSLDKVYNKLSMFSKKQIDEGISLLSQKEKQFLYWGDIDSFPEFDMYFYFYILPKIKNNILGLNLIKKTHVKDKTKKEVKKEVKSTCDLNGKKVEEKRRGRKIKTIFEVCKDYSRELVIEVLQELNEKDRKLFYLMNGDDLDHPVRDASVSEKDKVDYRCILIPKIKNKLEKKSKTIQAIDDKNISSKGEVSEDINISLKEDEIIDDINKLVLNNEVLRHLDTIDMLLLKLKFSEVNFTDEQIASYVGINPEDVSFFLRRALINYREEFNKYSNEENNKVSEDEVNTLAKIFKH